MDSPNKCGYCSYSPDTLDPFLIHFRNHHPFDEIKILFPKPDEKRKYQVKNCNMNSEALGKHELPFGDDLVLTQVETVGGLPDNIIY